MEVSKLTQKTSVSRRSFFSRSVQTVACGAALPGLFDSLAAGSAKAAEGPGYGPLRPAGDELALPPGFQYTVVSYEGERMDDGYPVPKAMDGMAAFPLPNGNILLIRNHEDAEAPARLRPRPADSTSTTAGILNSVLTTDYGPRTFAYDAYTGGGTTSIEVDARTRRAVRQWWSLVGTFRNCAGGTTPWGSWLSCEETFEAASSTGAEKDHGYVFEVPVATEPGHPARPVALTRLGRMAHEAAAVDPATGIIYETEDQGDVSGFYRFVPESKPTAPGQLAMMGGRLEMLRVIGSDRYETAVGQKVGSVLPVGWVPVSDPDPRPPTVTESGVTMASIFKQGRDAGGAIFRRLEGIWWKDGKVFFTSTNGGDQGLGQVWIYDPAAETLTLLYESSGIHDLDFPDNLTPSPRGGIVMCEDGTGAQFLRGLSPSGERFDFARNLHSSVEFAGACFSPDGQTLFVNIYGRSSVRTVQPYRSPVQIPVGQEKHEKALTLAIWGPWGTGLL